MDGTRSPIQSVLDIFATDLADLRFADVDAPTFVRLAADVDVAVEAVTSAQAARDAAHAALAERQKTLLDYAQRAVAYARVYAENDDALSARLSAIALPRPARRRAADDTLVLSPSPRATPQEPREPSEPREKRRQPKSRTPELLAAIAPAAVAEE